MQKCLIISKNQVFNRHLFLQASRYAKHAELWSDFFLIKGVFLHNWNSCTVL